MTREKKFTPDWDEVGPELLEACKDAELYIRGLSNNHRSVGEYTAELDILATLRIAQAKTVQGG